MYLLEWLARDGAFDRGAKARTVILPDRFVCRASPEEMYQDAALTADDITAKAMETLGVVDGRFGLRA